MIKCSCKNRSIFYFLEVMRLIAIVFILFSSDCFAQRRVANISVEVLVIGGGTGGTAAGIQAARNGAKTLIVEPTTMLGGMITAAGVSCTDGNNDFASGIWQELREALYKHYGKKNLATGWVSNTCFEPHVGDSIFKAWAVKEKNLRVKYGFYLETILKKGNKVVGAKFRNDANDECINVTAQIIIDATELGDAFAMAGAAYDVGMDDPVISGEKDARRKNNIIQDLTWAAVLKDYGAGVDKTISKPLNYNAKKYYCCNLNAPCDSIAWNGDKLKMLNYGKLPNKKYMLNWPAHGNDTYLDVINESVEKRKEKYELAKQHTLGFIYFMQTELGLKNIGLADDELDNGLALIPYNREGRRMKGVVRLNIEHLKNPYNYSLYKNGIAVGNYPVDHHHAQYPGKVPEIGFPPIPAYNIPLGCLIPEKIEGLIVCEKGISVTNIVNGTTRLQPVVLLTGQAAGMLAAICVKEKKQPRNVEVRMVQQNLLKAKCYLMPFSDVPPTNPYWKAIQMAGVSGILKGVGLAKGWENKMFFYPDSTISTKEFMTAFYEFKNLKASWFNNDSLLNQSFAISVLDLEEVDLHSSEKLMIRNMEQVYEAQKKIWENSVLKNFEPKLPVKRKELAVLIDLYLAKN
jgi:hypothetical protein